MWGDDMPLIVNGSTPGVIKYNGNNVSKFAYGGTIIWSQDVSVVYTAACSNQKINTNPSFTLTTSAPSPVYGSGTYEYVLKIPYKKTTSTAFSSQAYLKPELKSSNGSVVKSWEKKLTNGTAGVDVRYMTLSWTSTTWLGDASSYKLTITFSGGNGGNVQYPSDHDITLTMTNE